MTSPKLTAVDEESRHIALEIYKHTTLSTFSKALDVLEELRSDTPSRVCESMIPGAIYEAGRRAGIRAERERRKESLPEDFNLHDAVSSIQSFVFAESSREKLLQEVEKIRTAAKAGGYTGDPVFTILDVSFVVFRNIVGLKV